jgi:hypothetical protein
MIFPWAFHVFTKSCGWNHHKSYDFLSAWVPITNFKCLNPTIDHQSFTVEKIPKHIWWLIVGLRLFIFWWIPLCFSPIFHCWIPSHPNRSGSRPCSPGHSRRFRSSQGSPEPEADLEMPSMRTLGLDLTNQFLVILVGNIHVYYCIKGIHDLFTISFLVGPFPRGDLFLKL